MNPGSRQRITAPQLRGPTKAHGAAKPEDGIASRALCWARLMSRLRQGEKALSGAHGVTQVGGVLAGGRAELAAVFPAEL
ncbi:hypothetical protein GCM10009780_76130 [Actinomadura alba]